MEDMILPIHNFGEGGSGLHNVRSFITGSGIGSPSIWRGDVGGDPEDWKAP